ncbi:MAG: hypothetical protein ACXVRK_12825 [Gaiellaceae bacterium]
MTRKSGVVGRARRHRRRATALAAPRTVSLRTRAGEDRQAIAKQCGTSVGMLERSYPFAIEDLEDEGPKPVVEERLAGRQVAPAGKRRQLRVARVRC